MPRAESLLCGESVVLWGVLVGRLAEGKEKEKPQGKVRPSPGRGCPERTRSTGRREQRSLPVFPQAQKATGLHLGPQTL